MKHAWGPQGCAARPATKIEGRTPPHNSTRLPGLGKGVRAQHYHLTTCVANPRHRVPESEELFCHTGQLAQPNQDYVFSKRAAFFNGLKCKVGHIMAKAAALEVNLNLAPSVPSAPCTPARNSNAQLIYALNLSHHVLPLQ
jgi:hypothetical protein